MPAAHSAHPPRNSDIFDTGSRGYSTPRLLVTGRKFRESLPRPCSVGRGPLGARGADGTTRKCPFKPVPRAEIPKIIAHSSTRMLALPSRTAQEFLLEWFSPGAARELYAESRKTGSGPNRLTGFRVSVCQMFQICQGVSQRKNRPLLAGEGNSENVCPQRLSLQLPAS